MWISCKYTYIPSLSPHPSHPSRSSRSRLGDELKLSIDACTRPCVKQLAGGSLLHSTVSSAQDSGFLIGLSASVFAPDQVSSTGHPQGSFQHLSQVSYMLVDCVCFMWASFAQTHFRVKATVLPESGLPRDEHPTMLPQPLCPQHHLHSLRCLASLPFLQMYWVRPVNRSWHLLFPQPGAPSSGISMACPRTAFRSRLRLLSLSLPLVS